MDEDVLRLERAFRERPDDEVAARAYQAALLRIGKRETVRELYTLKFQCPLRWEQLDPDDGLWVKHCAKCDRQVHFVRSESELAASVKRGECVAVTRDVAVRCLDGFADDPALHPAKEPGSPCVVAADRRPVPQLMGVVAAPPPPVPRPPEPVSETWVSKLGRLFGRHSGS